jgi:SSS family solute:Na+ symporter
MGGGGVAPGSHFTWLDLIVLAVYFALSMGVGAYFYLTGKSRDTEGYTAAGRSLPGIVVGLSILATYLSSISFLALPGNAYKGNWNAFVFSLSLPIAGWIAVRYFVPFYRSRREVSAYHHLEARFGPWARLYTGIAYLLMQAARMGSVMFLMALPMEALLGWDIKVIILITGVSVTLYSLVGGLVAVIWADAIQAVVLMAGALACLALMLIRMPDGVGQMFEIAAENGKFSLGGFGPSLMERTFWVVLIYGIFINLTNFGIDQNFVQRYIASKSDREAAKSLWFGALLYIPVSAVFFFIGTALFAFYAVRADQLPPDYLDPKMSDRVFPYFIVSQLPPGVTGLLIAAIFAAAMSTISTSLNSGATILMTDVYKRYIRPGATEKEMMTSLYLNTFGFGALGTVIALLLIRAEGILDTWWILQGIFAGGMLGLFLLGIISRRAKNPAAVTGVLAGVAVIAWMSASPALAKAGLFPESLKNPLDSYLTIVFGTLTILLTGILVARAIPRREP